MTAWQCWSSSAAGWRNWKSASPFWNANKASFDVKILNREITTRFEKLQRGIQLYQSHSYKRTVNEMPVVWQKGAARLLDYGGSGRPVFVIPSLINRATILDLKQNYSFLRYLGAQGMHPFLLDWGAPGADENAFSLDDYILKILLTALRFAHDTTAQKPVLLGYCMGGLLATAAAQLQPDLCAGLALLATPWDFHKEQTPLPLSMRETQADLVDRIGHMPVDMIQSFFWALDPMQTVKKFVRFADCDQTSAEAHHFVAVEDWLNDGIPMTASVARTCLVDWYGKNAPAEKQWRVGDAIINPASLTMPTLAIIPQHDRIVPPASAAALSQIIPGCLRIDPPLGHIGMMVSAKAEQLVWNPLARWLKDS